MNFPSAKIKSVKGNLGSQEITITFTVDISGDTLETATNLSDYVDKKMGRVDVTIDPQQPPLVGMSKAGGK